MYSLLPHNTFKLDVKTKHFIEYGSVIELKRHIEEKNITTPYLHIGEGSNLLFTKDYEGTIIHSKIDTVEVLNQTEECVEVRVGGGLLWDKFVEICVENGWYGAENLSLIPGEVGASAVQNIGAYGVEVCDIIDRVETISIEGKERVFANSECGYSYRYSIFKQAENKNLFVTYVVFRLGKKEKYNIEYGAIKNKLQELGRVLSLQLLRKAIIDIRQEKLPDYKEVGNAGSFFMNPIVDVSVFNEIQKSYPDTPHYKVSDDKIKVPAGWLIEQCGWKGKSLGKAAVYHKQALVIINTGGATSSDIIAIAKEVQKSVADKFGIQITPEVNYI